MSINYINVVCRKTNYFDIKQYIHFNAKIFLYFNFYILVIT